jgi:hypothetical protein
VKIEAEIGMIVWGELNWLGTMNHEAEVTSSNPPLIFPSPCVNLSKKKKKRNLLQV